MRRRRRLRHLPCACRAALGGAAAAGQRGRDRYARRGIRCDGGITALVPDPADAGDGWSPFEAGARHGTIAALRKDSYRLAGLAGIRAYIARRYGARAVAACRTAVSR